MEYFPEFKPFPLLRGHFFQTIIGSFLNLYWNPPSDRHFVDLPDGDSLSLEITTPAEWKHTDLTVVLIHGLCGSHQSAYMIRIANRLSLLGVKVVRMNQRGCGSGKGFARKMYLDTSDEDVHEVLKFLKKQYSYSPIILVGFSLGGNIALKFAGKLQHEAKRFIEEIIAVSPPVDIGRCTELLSESKNWIYEKYLSDLLIKDAIFRHRHFPDLPSLKLPKGMRIIDFHKLYLAPGSGFDRVEDYHRACSSIHCVERITVPCKILFAKDDPIIDASGLDHMALPNHIKIYKAPGGGHMGFLSAPSRKTGVRWLDSVLISWILKSEFF